MTRPPQMADRVQPVFVEVPGGGLRSRSGCQKAKMVVVVQKNLSWILISGLIVVFRYKNLITVT